MPSNYLIEFLNEKLVPMRIKTKYIVYPTFYILFNPPQKKKKFKHFFFFDILLYDHAHIIYPYFLAFFGNELCKTMVSQSTCVLKSIYILPYAN